MNALQDAMQNIAFGKEPGRGHPELITPILREAIANRVGWGTMIYRCDSCKFEWEVWLAIGVEGPPALREAGVYIASPFMIRCYAWPNMQACDGKMEHVEWNRDREFMPALIPDDAPRFVVPHMDGSQGAELAIPEPALIRARRFHDEGPDE